MRCAHFRTGCIAARVSSCRQLFRWPSLLELNVSRTAACRRMLCGRHVFALNRPNSLVISLNGETSSPALHQLNHHTFTMATMTTETRTRTRTAPTFTSIPVLDLDLVHSPSTRPQFLAQLQEALVIAGFFYLKNAEKWVPTDVQKNFVEKSKALCDQPLEKKQEIDMINSKHFLGYSRMGLERTAMKVDHREMFDVSLLLLDAEIAD